jgi:hypothetical protein
MHGLENVNSHERFHDLCALAMSGILSTQEWADLTGHLQSCDECRQAFREYEALTKEGMPMLAARYCRQDEEEQWDNSKIRQRLFERITDAGQEAGAGLLIETPRRLRARDLRSFATPARILVAACLLFVIGIGLYRQFGEWRAAAKRPLVSTDQQLQKWVAEKQMLEGALAGREKSLAQAQSENSQKQIRIDQLESHIRLLEARADELGKAKMAADEQLRSISQQRADLVHLRDTMEAQFRDLQNAYQNVQLELVGLRAERDRVKLRMASLETDVEALTLANRDQQRRLQDQEQYLSQDRDIRELMGARQLYVADVFDVSSDSRTRRPFGRVFYTKGKSLIFYAFDLDRQPGVKNAAFQAWGRNEASQKKPLSLGILYKDDDASRRWVLRFDDPRRLEEIDSVFVTVEPSGGSKKPTGKAFLVASLRREANHP